MPALNGLLESFINCFDAGWFKGYKEKSVLSKVTQALTSLAWLQQYRFVLWLCEWLMGIQSWGQGCECHEADLLAGKEVKCYFKGKRLRRAFTWTMARLREGLEDANSWGVSRFGGTIQFLQEP